ncbi:hypothetical protein F3Y22_tig00110418pilonHSYRG00228 [Hibiscus syriacus]|uniref:Cobalamin-independent methionine synthase MetE N-terminal domain-containing protein n=1 Tax=Hibiscus syriacus TaxID=106335 RepID=A0A6A3AQZ0_HIBSY|nr:hypothetical protein F3Y22_tig00110418pilonHSYRG00228 [Hibiscus syriacus]
MDQLDEPTLVLDLESHQLQASTHAYSELGSSLYGLNVLVQTYFADAELWSLHHARFSILRSTLCTKLSWTKKLKSLAKALVGEKDEVFFTSNAVAHASRKSSPRVTNEAVQKAAAGLRGSNHRRATDVSVRLDAQQKKLNLPILPTTTCGCHSHGR